MNAQLVVDNTSAQPLVSREIYVERISSQWRRSKEHVIELGRMLIEAKEKLGHGQFTSMIYIDLAPLGLGPDTAQRFMRLARDTRLSNPESSQVLPRSPDALDILRRLPPDKFERYVTEGKINATMTIEDCKALHPIQRPTRHVEARDEDELRTPIMDMDQLIATMKGYRTLQGTPQRTTDEDAGLQEGYTSKLEVDIKRAVNESWWLWMGSLNLAMLLIPITGSTANRTKCPCCERVL